MAVKIISDLNEFESPSATNSWRAALAECPPPMGGNHQKWCVAWGKCYASLTSGVRPIAWIEGNNTDEDGVLWFDSLEEATSYFVDVATAYNPVMP